MSTIVKKNIDPHSVIIDTNILFDSDKSNVVNDEFDRFWSEHAAEANLQLLIPEVVIGEILFQQTTAALKTLERANNSFTKLSSFTGGQFSHRASEARVKKEVKKRFEKWAKQKKYKKLITPVDSIDWKNMIESAIWRTPPFTHNDKKEEEEKGFRDALIMETVIEHSNSETGKKIVFITNDRVLREASEDRLKNDETFSAFETLDDFEAYLRLEKESLEQSFIKAVVIRASKKFFEKGNQNSLVYTGNLTNQLKEKFKNKFSNPERLVIEDSEDGFYSDGTWAPTGKGIFGVITRPQFQRIEGKNTYIWISKIKYTRTYEGQSAFDEELYEWTHEIFFDISWRSNITVNKRFTNMEIIDTKVIESKFEPSSDQ
ncbi:PIN domain-containing protein [Microbulbifer sp. GL-2]|uniref:PIN domain-containing protein n=1 Tax=Microbulbifer sp. GL-2 TaxID=2591606 RepID=UPI001164F8BF|nr:PIN domain-containing protein [Microbulbifer sp. GL-2]BBM00173.1 hypothetical protein GL2_02470 [Microbulbifer sp. GL-2]